MAGWSSKQLVLSVAVGGYEPIERLSSSAVADLGASMANDLRRRVREISPGECLPRTSARIERARRLPQIDGQLLLEVVQVGLMQSNVEGTLSERARKRAMELANDSDVRMNPPKVMPAPVGKTTTTVIARSDERLPPAGPLILREYKGQQVQVKVLGSGFEFEGSVFKSLSAVVKHITGQYCNGYLFFRLGGAK